MLSNHLFLIGTLLLSLNFVRFLGLAISDWFYLGALVLALLETLFMDRKNLICWMRNRFYLPAGLILLGALISTFSARYLQIALIEILQQLFVITLFISLIWVMIRRGRTNAVIQAFILSGVFTALIASIDYFAGTNFGPILSGTPDVKLWGRYAGATGHPNKLGYFLAITSILSIHYFVKARGSRHHLTSVFWFLLIHIQLLGLYLSNSLTAYLGFILGITLMTATLKFFRYLVLKMFISSILISVLLISITTLLGARLESLNIFQRSGSISNALFRVKTYSSHSRLIVYEQSIQRIVENPFVGAGYDQLASSGISFDMRKLSFTVHNSLLQIWYAGGLLSFIGWIFIMTHIGWTALMALFIKCNYLSPLLAISSASLAILLMDQFQDATYQREKWLVVGLLMGLTWTKSRIHISHSFIMEKK